MMLRHARRSDAARSRGLVALPSSSSGTYYRFLGIIVFIYGIVAVGLNILRRLCRAVLARPCRADGDGRLYDGAPDQGARADLFLRGRPACTSGSASFAGTVVAAVFGALLAFPALRVRGPYLAMVTIAFGWVIFKILQEWVSVTGGDLGLASIPKAADRRPTCSRRRASTTSCWRCFVPRWLLQYRLVSSEFGLRIRAMKHSEIAVASVGIDVYRLKVSSSSSARPSPDSAARCSPTSRTTSAPTISSSSARCSFCSPCCSAAPAP